MFPHSFLSAFVLLVSGAPALARLHPRASSNDSLTSDIPLISRRWGQVSTYADNAENEFGVQDVGLPDGCQVESVQLLQRHANRFPTSYVDDGVNNEAFAAKVANFTAGSSASFTGPLAFLNSYHYIMLEGTLTGLGAVTEFNAGASFWNRYGRTLYDAAVGQIAYNASYYNGTARPKPLLRTTSQSRIHNSQINWALGFFGPSFQAAASADLSDWDENFDVLIIPEGGTENNTLAAYDACFNDFISGIGDLGDLDLYLYLPRYLQNATARLQTYVPSGFNLTLNDTYAMQSICAYEQVWHDGYLASTID